MIKGLKRKTVIVVFALFLVLSLVGCKQKEKVNIDFRNGDVSVITTVKKGSIIDNKIINLDSEQNQFELFYDEFKIEKYNNEPIDKDTIIYIVTKEDGYSIDFFKLFDHMKQLYIDTYHPEIEIENISISEYLGSYNNSFVLVFNNSLDNTNDKKVVELTYEGYDFSYEEGSPICVWNNGKFYDIKKAYEDNLLTKEDLEKIAFLHDKEERAKIINSAKETFLNPGKYVISNYPEFTMDDIIIKKILGVYNGYFVAIMTIANISGETCSFGQSIDDPRNLEIGGLKFSRSLYSQLFVAKDGKYCTLSNIYEENLITDNDLHLIYYMFKNDSQLKQ